MEASALAGTLLDEFLVANRSLVDVCRARPTWINENIAGREVPTLHVVWAALARRANGAAARIHCDFEFGRKFPTRKLLATFRFKLGSVCDENLWKTPLIESFTRQHERATTWNIFDNSKC